MSELVSLDDAFSQAASEVEDAPTSLPEGDPYAEQAEIFEPETTAEESEVEPSEVEELFEPEDLGKLEEPEAPAVDIDGQTFEIPGVDQPVTFQELRDGYLRQADYTRKTQAVAEQRKANEKALALYEAIQADPMKVARQIAEEVGLVQPGTEPVKAVEFSVYQTQEAVEAEIERRVSEEITKHPLVQQANMVQGERWVEGEFQKLEASHNVKLGPKSRQAILQFAASRGITDFDLVFNHLNAQKAERAVNTQRLSNAAPGRPTGRAVEKPVSEHAATLDDAFVMAEAELSKKR